MIIMHTQLLFKEAVLMAIASGAGAQQERFNGSNQEVCI
jgi:hypothetical protein